MSKFSGASYTVHRGCPQISRLFYADDVLLFTYGAKKNIDAMMNVLKQYEEVSGQCLNSTERKFYCHHALSASRKASIEQQTGFREGSFPFMYLGSPIS